MLRALFTVDLEFPPLVPVYSAVAHAETVFIDGQTHIVFDQYLGQTFNKLNRLFFDRATKAQVSGYLHKLHATRALAAGRVDLALPHALMHFATQTLDIPGEPTLPEETRAYYTACQETFVIAHEMTHHVFRQYPHIANCFKQYCFDLMGLLELPLNQGTPRERAQQVDQKFYSALESGDPSESTVPAGGLPDIPGSGISILRASYGIDAFNSQTSTRVLEECICDAAALMAIPGMFGGSRPGDALLAAFMGLHHLRLIRMADQTVGGSPGRLEGDVLLSKTMVGETQYRFEFLKSMCETLAEISPEGLFAVDAEPFASHEFVPSLGLLNEEYAARIIFARGDVIRDSLDMDLRRGAEKFVYQNPFPEEVEDLHDMVRLLCNLPA